MMVAPRVTECNHYFCKLCIDGKKICSVCQQPTNKQDRSQTVERAVFELARLGRLTKLIRDSDAEWVFNEDADKIKELITEKKVSDATGGGIVLDWAGNIQM